MLNKTYKSNTKETILYNNILLLSRNKIFYTKFNLSDTFQNRINLIFMHISFLFIKIKNEKNNEIYKNFYQNMFDLIFEKIELNMREIGHGDVIVNKNMKFLVKTFYNILLNCEKYKVKTQSSKIVFFSKYLVQNSSEIHTNINQIINYFDKYQAFCFDLSLDSVLKGNLNFNFK